MLIVLPSMPCLSLACSVCPLSCKTVWIRRLAPALQRSSIVLSAMQVLVGDNSLHHILHPSLVSSSPFDLSRKLKELVQRGVSTQIPRPATDSELRYISHSPLSIPIRESDDRTATQHAVRIRDFPNFYASTPSSSESQASRALDSGWNSQPALSAIHPGQACRNAAITRTAFGAAPRGRRVIASHLSTSRFDLEQATSSQIRPTRYRM